MSKPNFLFPIDFKSALILALTFACGALLTRLNFVQQQIESADGGPVLASTASSEGRTSTRNYGGRVVYQSELGAILRDFATADHRHYESDHSTNFRSSVASISSDHRHDGISGYAAADHTHPGLRSDPSKFATLRHTHNAVPEHSHEYDWWMEQFARKGHKHHD